MAVLLAGVTFFGPERKDASFGAGEAEPTPLGPAGVVDPRAV